jgi:hypothetical protein
MKRPSSAALFGVILLVLAGVFVVSTRHGRDSGGDEAPAPAAHRNPERPARGLDPANSSASAKLSEATPLVLTEEGLADFSNYDRNGDGDPEADAFLEVYRRVDTSAGKIDMLDNVRAFDTLDQPPLNDLLIDQAAKAEDAEVRRAAREALFEHGGAKAHEALAVYLESETLAADRQKLEKLLGDLQRPSLTQVRSRSKNPPTTPSPPRTNN